MKKALIFILLFGLVATALFSLLGYFGESNWRLDLFNHFRFHYFLILIVGSGLLAYFRWKRALIFLPFILLLGLDIAPLYLGSSTDSQNETIKIASINLLRTNHQYALAKNYLNRSKPDVIVFIEYTAAWHKNLTPLLNDYAYHLKVVQEDNFGIAVYSKLPVHNIQKVLLGKTGLPSIVGDLQLNNKSLKLIATHPNPGISAFDFDSRNDQYQALANYIKEQTQEVLMIGDLNSTSFSPHFKKLLKNASLKDSRLGFGLQPTWPNVYGLAQITIDHCLATDGIFIQSRKLGEDIGSDHLPIEVIIGLK